MSKWSTITIGEHCLVTSSKRFHLSERSENGVPFYCSKEIIQKVNGQEITDCDYIREEFYEQVKEKYGVPEAGDLLITTRGTYGIPYIYQQSDRFYFADGNLTWLKDFDDQLSAKYLLYWIKSHEGQGKIDAIAKGTAQKAVPIAGIKMLQLSVPPIDDQYRIVNVLSSYDELIENNYKQIKLLEEAAQRLYKEWFVDLRFPGHEDVQIIDGVPENWKSCFLENLNIRIESGSRPKGGIDASLKQGIPSIGAENVIGLGQYNYSSEKLIDFEFYSNMKKGKLKDRDILIYKDGAYIGRTSLFQDGFPHPLAAVNEHVFLVHSYEEELQYYLFFTLYQQEYYLKMQKLNKNAAQPGINAKALKSLPILLPREEIVYDFNEMITPIIRSIFCLAKANKCLSEARDRLLPKLMSGEIEL